MLRISESYILGFDISQEDEAVLTVVTRVSNTLEYVNTLIGEDARAMYEKLTNQSLPVNTGIPTIEYLERGNIK